jgi:hypothetical protein
MRVLPFAIVAFTLAGCQTSTGFLPAGPNTYTTTERVAPILGGSTTAQEKALTNANAFCAQQGKVFVPNNMGTEASANPYGPTTYTVTFRCLMADDPAVKTFQLQQAPNVIVEQRNR